MVLPFFSYKLFLYCIYVKRSCNDMNSTKLPRSVQKQLLTDQQHEIEA